jgi:hypothetical protein
MSRAIFCILFLSAALRTIGQDLVNNQYSVFRIPAGQDTTTFVVVGNRDELKKRKPLLIFRQGSLPIPLFGRYKRGISAIIFPFKAQKYMSNYHIVAIAKPGVALLADSATMARTVETRDPSFSSQKYLDHNYLDFYVDQTNQVIDYLLKQPFVDPSKVAICGGSEGYPIAIKVAATNQKVTHLIGFSGLLEGRWQAQLRETRERANAGEYAQQQAQQAIESMYAYWQEVLKNPTSTAPSGGDTNYATYSFSTSNTLEHLLSLNIPIYICYGTADRTASLNDLLPLEFARKGKTNLTLKPYLDYDHNFYQLVRDGKGQVVDQVYKGDEVAGDYLNWLNSH